MTKENVSQIIGLIDDKYIEEAYRLSPSVEEDSNTFSVESGKKPQKHFLRIKWLIIPAGIVLIPTIVSLLFLSLAEAKEYQTASSFFREYGLSEDGLSRFDVKEVYRDISTHRFTYKKTADVIQKAVPGLMINLQDPSPDEIAYLWDKAFWSKEQYEQSLSKDGLVFHTEEFSVYDEERHCNNWEKSVLKCVDNGEEIWSVEFSEFIVSAYQLVHSGDCIFVWGFDQTWQRTQDSNSHLIDWIACIDDHGTVLWKKKMDHGFPDEIIGSVIANEDGTWAIFSQGNYENLCFSLYDRNGKELVFRKNDLGVRRWRLGKATTFGEGYLIQYDSDMRSKAAYFYKIDREGNLIGGFSYEAEDCDYHVSDLMEYADRVYFSTYSTTKPKEEGTREIDDLIESAFKKNDLEISSEELTPLVREKYTAVLLTCDLEGGTPEKFYSVNGALGGNLSVNEKGELGWNVESITSTYFSPNTNSFTIGGSSKLYRYDFDLQGTLIEEVDTGEIVPFYR